MGLQYLLTLQRAVAFHKRSMFNLIFLLFSISFTVSSFGVRSSQVIYVGSSKYAMMSVECVHLKQLNQSTVVQTRLNWICRLCNLVSFLCLFPLEALWPDVCEVSVISEFDSVKCLISWGRTLTVNTYGKRWKATIVLFLLREPRLQKVAIFLSNCYLCILL